MTVPSIQIITDTRTELPTRAHPTDACVDLCASIKKPIRLCFGKQSLVPTGIKVNIPESPEEFNWVMEITPRSGLANKFGITVTNSPGQIDENYQGEIMVIVKNTKKNMFVIEPGMKFAQMKLTKSYNFNWLRVSSFGETTDRSDSGFGSSND